MRKGGNVPNKGKNIRWRKVQPLLVERRWQRSKEVYWAARGSPKNGLVSATGWEKVASSRLVAGTKKELHVAWEDCGVAVQGGAVCYWACSSLVVVKVASSKCRHCGSGGLMRVQVLVDAA